MINIQELQNLTKEALEEQQKQYLGVIGKILPTIEKNMIEAARSGEYSLSFATPRDNFNRKYPANMIVFLTSQIEYLTGCETTFVNDKIIISWEEKE